MPLPALRRPPRLQLHYILAGQLESSFSTSHAAIKNQWNGMVEWNTGMEYWNGLVSAKNIVILYKYLDSVVMKIISRGTNLQDRAKDAILSLAII